MSQRESGYARKERDFYETPEWVTEALMPHIGIDQIKCVWECAQGDRKMTRVLAKKFCVYGTDLADGHDFLLYPRLPTRLEVGASVFKPPILYSSLPKELNINAIITNPSYELAQDFIEHALRLMEPVDGVVAMLLRTDYDHAKSRMHLFRDCPAFAKKLVLTKRIVWFEPPPGEKGKSPSFNHAWFVWDWRHEGPPVLAYGP